MKTVSSTIVICILVLGVQAPSFAAEQNKEDKQKVSSKLESKNSLALNLGLCSALGLGGVAYSRQKSEHFEMEFGVGYGFSGLQLSLMPKISFGGEHSRFVSGAGIALGLPLSDNIDEQGPTTASLWLNLDLIGYQYKFSKRDGVGFYLLLAGGLTIGLAGEYNDYQICFLGCEDDSLEHRSYQGIVFGQARVGVGITF